MCRCRRWAQASSISNGFSGIISMSAPPVSAPESGIQPALRPITSITITRSWDSAVVWSRSITSVATWTAVWKPTVTSVPARSLSMVLGTPITGMPRSESAAPAPSVPSPPIATSPSSPWRSIAPRIRSGPSSARIGLTPELPRIVPPRCRIPRAVTGSSTIVSSSRTPRHPSWNPTNVTSRCAPVRTIARITAFNPGQSPPPVSTPKRMQAPYRGPGRHRGATGKQVGWRRARPSDPRPHRSARRDLLVRVDGARGAGRSVRALCRRPAVPQPGPLRPPLGDDLRAGPAGERLGRLCEVGDPRRAPAVAHEVHRGLDLRPHRSAAELALLQQPLRLGDVHALDLLGHQRPEPALHARDVGEDQQDLGVHLAPQDRRGEILVDDPLLTDQPRPLLDHRHAAAPGRDHDDAVGDQLADHGRLDDRVRLRARNDPAPSTVRIGLDRPPPLLLPPARLRLGEVRADVLRRVAERRVLWPYAGEREDRRDRPFRPPLEEDVADGDLQQVADLALALGAADVQRHRMHLLGRGLLLQQDPADLRPIAVRHDAPPAVGRDVGDPLRGCPRGGVHLVIRVGRAAPEQRAAAGGDHDPGHRVPSCAARRRTKVTISAVGPVPWSRGTTPDRPPIGPARSRRMARRNGSRRSGTRGTRRATAADAARRRRAAGPRRAKRTTRVRRSGSVGAAGRR